MGLFDIFRPKTDEQTTEIKTESSEKQITNKKNNQEQRPVVNEQPHKPEPLHCNDRIKQELDEQQLKAVEAPLGNTCVFAIAGSGKTRTLTYRVANLIANGIDESEIMLLTFTNKAADEMTERICNVLSKKRLNMISGTFHSVASKFLREYAKEIGYSKKFKIITSGTQRTLIEGCRSEYLEKYMEGFNNDEFPSKNVIADIYSGAINHNKTFREYIAEYYSYYKNETPDGIILILKDYVERKEKENMMDFDDLLLNFMDLLSLEDVRKRINRKYKYIFVDEYQDINWMQYNILEYLNGDNNMFVIGDAKQCIYQFRGSRPEYIDLFKQTHKNVSSYKLTYNYRSTPEILKLGEEAIFYNDPHNPVVMKTKNSKGKMPLIFGCGNETEETEKIVEYIKENKFKYSETAILVRRGAQISIVEKTMKKTGIPYNLVGSVSMYESQHIQDLVSFLQLIDDKENEAAFLRCVMLFRGIGQKIASEMYKKLSSVKFDYFMAEKSSRGTQKNVFSSMANIVSKRYDDITSMLQCIINGFYGNYAMNRFPDFEDRMDDIRYLFQQAREYKDLTEFLDDISMMRKTERNHGNDCITIITMHKAKGLEWDNVFIPFIDKGEYPRCRDKDYINNTENIQNERNLFYVAITRAKKNLFISYSLFYTEKPAGPSPFLEELDGDAYDADFFGLEEQK